MSSRLIFKQFGEHIFGRTRLTNPNKTFAASLYTSGLRRSIDDVWKLGKLNHVAIATNDMAKSVDFYKNVLKADKVSKLVPLPEHGVNTVFVELANSKIELIDPLGDQSPIAGFLSKNKNGGIHHLCIEVDSIANALKTLKAKNIRTLSAEPVTGAHGKPVVFLHPKDTNGVLIELEEA